MSTTTKKSTGLFARSKGSLNAIEITSSDSNITRSSPSNVYPIHSLDSTDPRYVKIYTDDIHYVLAWGNSINGGDTITMLQNFERLNETELIVGFYHRPKDTSDPKQGKWTEIMIGIKGKDEMSLCMFISNKTAEKLAASTAAAVTTQTTKAKNAEEVPAQPVADEVAVV